MSSPSFLPQRLPLMRSASRFAPGWWLLLGTLSALQAQAPDPDRAPDAPPFGPRQEDHGAPLSPEDRKQLHEALAQAWEDPEVVRARQDVHRATETYRRVLRETVSRIDPAAVPLIGKLHEKSRVEAMRHKLPPEASFPPWVFAPLPRDPAAAVDALAQAEVRFRSLDGPDRDHFLRVAKQLGKTGALRPALATPPPPSDREKEKNGREFFKHRRELREKFLKEMARSDARIAELLATAPARPPGNSGPAGPAEIRIKEPVPGPPIAP